MRISNTVKYALGVTAAAAILAGCSGGSQIAPSAGGSSATSYARQAQAHGVSTLIPERLLIKTPGSVLGKIAPLAKAGKAGLYDRRR
jgi:hypothetical protein